MLQVTSECDMGLWDTIISYFEH